ncbi:MAG: hypothetical protein IPM21_00360 [Acidobacteria bacterium]|nr:hypothetical protein [Acidobacteriota bacterium]MBK7935109.1 hypothetical protein [Acidobacteriota bacterium]MBK9162381.1 hypothetical protein [Acidobacteriota bacterium]
MKTYPYLRAYMAGITIPTILLVLFVTVFTFARHEYSELIPIERLIVFPLAIVPNLWGIWNMAYVRLRRNRYLSIGLHGALLTFVQAMTAFGIAKLTDVEIPSVVASAFPFGFPVLVIVFYLVWRHVVSFFNAILGID